MKKIIFIVILSVLLTGCSTVFSDVTEIEAVNLQNGDNTLIPKESKDADIILDAVNKKDKTEEDISTLLNYEIILKKDKSWEIYKIYFDTGSQAAYIAKDDTIYKIKDNAARQLFLSQVFSYIYVS